MESRLHVHMEAVQRRRVEINVGPLKGLRTNVYLRLNNNLGTNPPVSLRSATTHGRRRRGRKLTKKRKGVNQRKGKRR